MWAPGGLGLGGIQRLDSGLCPCSCSCGEGVSSRSRGGASFLVCVPWLGMMWAPWCGFPLGWALQRSLRLGPAVLAGCAVCWLGSSWQVMVFLLPFLVCSCVVLISWACSSPCWRSWSAWGALARFGSIVIVPQAAGASFLFGPGVSLGWGLTWELGFLCFSVGLSFASFFLSL